MLTALTIAGFVVGLISAGGVIWLMLRLNRRQEDGGALTLLLQQLNELSRTVDEKMGETNRSMQDAVRHQFSESQRLIKDINAQVTENLVKVARGMTEAREASRQVMTIAEQLHNLEKVLKHQKQRGNLGEASLELILSNVLPPGAYRMQHSFRNGEMVDAVIETKEGLIPIDAKFSLDNYNRLVNEVDEARRAELEKEFKNDLKKRIDETAKYIRPEEKTLPFAFMFIPAEGIYYDLLINEVGAVKVNTRSLIDYAYNDKKVVIVSPTTFYAYLQSVLYGFKAFKIEEQAVEIRKRVNELGKHLKSFEEYHGKLGGALNTVVNHYNESGKEFKKIDKDILRMTGGSPGLEAPLVGKTEEL